MNDIADDYQDTMWLPRVYEEVIIDHFAGAKQMVFLAGPRQVGKTTIGQASQGFVERMLYYNWDVESHRSEILKGQAELREILSLLAARSQQPIIVFDEIHKYPEWKNFLKGFYDLYKEQLRIIVTGSARLDVYRRGNDSMMGRYFPYRVHPLSVAELVRPTLPESELSHPTTVTDDMLKRLLQFGGFPEPYLKNNRRFHQRWRRLRQQLIFREDIKDLSTVREIGQLELLASLLKSQVGQMVNYAKLATKVNVSVNTVKGWMETLDSFFFCYTISPWSQNIAKSLVKTPKVYLWDWSDVADEGARIENMVASHLLKAVHFWTDFGFGEYGLYYLRDKAKREVDFLVTKNGEPWFLVEVKKTDNGGLSKNLRYFQQATGAPHAFQIILDMPFKDVDVFAETGLRIVSAATFLSQLI